MSAANVTERPEPVYADRRVEEERAVVGNLGKLAVEQHIGQRVVNMPRTVRR